MKHEGVVILGCPRSGTTLLRRLLGAHPELASPPETGVLSAGARFLHAESFGEGLELGVRSGLAFSGFSEQEVVEPLRELCFGFFRTIAQAHQASYWLEKTAFDAFHVDEIEALCGESVRYVLIHRHGLDVACSLRELVHKMEHHPAELMPFVHRHARPLVAYAHAWVEVNRRLLRLADQRPHQVLSVQYEDLVADPAVEMARLWEGLELDADAEQLLEAAFSADAPGLGDWKTWSQGRVSEASVGRRRELSRSMTARLAAVVNPTLLALGYEELSPPRAQSAAQARRRLELELAAARMRAAAEQEASDPAGES